METFYLRPSTVTSAMLCGGRVALKSASDFNHLPNEALLFGTMTHESIEHMLLDRDQLSDTEFWAATDEAYVNNIPDHVDQHTVDAIKRPSEFLSRKRQGAFRGEVLDAVSAWYKDGWLDRFDTHEIYVEEPVEYPIKTVTTTAGTYRVVLRGTPDVVDVDTKTVFDWKTAGAPWNPKKVEGQFQRIAYPMMLTDDPCIYQMTYVVYDRSSGVWFPYNTEVPTKAEMRAALHQSLMVAKSILNGDFHYTPMGQGYTTRGWHCSPKYCDGWAVCKAKHLIADGKAEESALTIKERWS